MATSDDAGAVRVADTTEEKLALAQALVFVGKEVVAKAEGLEAVTVQGCVNGRPLRLRGLAGERSRSTFGRGSLDGLTLAAPDPKVAADSVGACLLRGASRKAMCKAVEVTVCAFVRPTAGAPGPSALHDPLQRTARAGG